MSLKKSNSIKTLLKENLYNSVCQAIIRIFQTRHFVIKLFLIIITTSTSVVCSFLIVKVMIAFFAYEVTTLTRTIFETPTLFPKITICNNHVFTTEYAVDFLRKINKEIDPSLDVFDEVKMQSLNSSYKSNLLR